jgi:hypothetical protein
MMISVEQLDLLAGSLQIVQSKVAGKFDRYTSDYNYFCFVRPGHGSSPGYIKGESFLPQKEIKQLFGYC